MKMHFEIPEQEVRALVLKQLEALFLTLSESEKTCLNHSIGTAFARCEHCFKNTPYKGYVREGEAVFNPFHSGQYAVFLYFLSNSLSKEASVHRSLAERVYYLNKALNGVELFFEIELPSIFMLDHPVGSVIGRAEFQDYFSFAQNCTVGNNWNKYPRVGCRVAMLANSTLIGDCKVGDNVILSANALVIDTDIPDCTIVFGSSPNLVLKRRSKAFFDFYFNNPGVKPDFK